MLALLHFFQGFVDVKAFEYMGDPKFAEWVNQENKTNDYHSLPELANLNLQSLISIFNRAAEVGLLTAHSGGYYSIHPALPWYFKNLFDEYYGEEPSAVSNQQSADHQPPATSNQLLATRSFVETMGQLSNFYTQQYVGGNRDAISQLTAEEPNLLHARRLARVHGWWDALTSTMQGLDTLYDHTGRRAEWKRLVEEIVPDLVDPTTDLPLRGREEQWGLVTEYRVRLAQEARQWDEAERWQRVLVNDGRKNAAPFLTLPPESLNDSQKYVVRTLAVSLEQLAIIMREEGKAECVEPSKEAITLHQKLGDHATEAISAFNLGHAYKNLPTLRDLAQAEGWYQRSLDLLDERDRLGRGKCLITLGIVAHERFKNARKANAPNDELLKHLNNAVRFYRQAIDLLPPNAVNDLAVTHNGLGIIYDDAGDLDRALHHDNEAIRYFESAGNFYGTAGTRRNVALALRDAGRLSDARAVCLRRVA